MISRDDIEAFRADLDPDVDAALEYSRRYHKGLPSDRWADGHAGAVKVARGIDRLFAVAFRGPLDEYQRNLDAMEPHPDPSRKAE